MNRNAILMIIRTIGFYLFNFISVIALSILLLVCVYRLPTEKIDSNVESSAVIFEREGDYPQLFSWCQSQLDNFTDALMLIEAADWEDLGTPLERSMLVKRGYISGRTTPTDILIDHYINGVEYDGGYACPRYWHMYLIFLKPLLSVMNYQSIRILNAIMQSFLVICTLILMIRKGLKQLIMPFLLSYLMLMPLAIFRSLQFSACFYIFLLGYIAVLIGYGRKRYTIIYVIFFNVGIVTALFDFLTYPIATFGIPCVLLIYFVGDFNLKDRMMEIIKVALLWGSGYAGMWISKWIVGGWLTEVNVIEDAVKSLTVRTSSYSSDGLQHFSLPFVWGINIYSFIRTPITILCISLCLYLIIRFIRNKCLTGKEVLNILIPYAVIAMAPFAWYTFAINHSAVHNFFANKACVVTCFSVLVALTDLNVKNVMRIRNAE